jgi:hypothetical protein
MVNETLPQIMLGQGSYEFCTRAVFHTERCVAETSHALRPKRTEKSRPRWTMKCHMSCVHVQKSL